MTVTLEQLLNLQGQPSEAFNEAARLIRHVPPQPGTAERLAELETLIRKDEQQRFGEIWSAYYAALN